MRIDLDEYTEKVRKIKDTFNVEWSNKSHPDEIDDERGAAGFDQIMDQVFKLLECYQGFDETNPQPAIEKAKEAHREVVKAACGFYESIASNMVTKAKQMIAQVKPTPKELLDVNPEVNNCRRKIQKAREKWERDDPEGLEILSDVIEKMDDVLDQIKLAIPTAVYTERRVEREETRSQWTVWALWITILVALGLGILNYCTSTPSPDTSPKETLENRKQR